jgi:tetratricopeptide (TPR) repeat protein
MFEFIKRLFKADDAPEPGSLVEELWIATLDGPKGGRFLEARETGYSARYLAGERAGEGRLLLELSRPDLFAWTEAPLYRHSDFVLEGEFAFPAGQAHSACGFLFRYQDEGNFYAALVSNDGFFRLDVVFNGSPRPLVAWTELPPRAEGEEAFSLRVIGHGSHFTLVVDDAWVAEAVDETFGRGHIAFAGQNYDAGGSAAKAGFELRSCMLEARAAEVETWYYRWNYYILPATETRRRLALTFFSMGECLEASVQLRKVERRRALGADELFLKAECALRLGLEDEAETALDACLALEPGNSDAAEEKANLLYLRGRYLELRDALADLLPTRRDNTRLLCLSGHARFGLGDFAGAAADYKAAADLDSEQALYRMNEARAWDQAGKRAEAAEAYLAAARLFSAQGADDDLALALARLSVLKPRSAELKEIKAKALYRAGKKDEAAKLLAELVVKGSRDSAVHYTLGLVLAERGEGEKALERFRRACELEPGFALYAFRYAERLFILGPRAGLPIAETQAAIARALALGPEDGWTLNLAGQEALARGELETARGYLEAARAALPGVPEPAINLADLESREGRLETALAALAPFPENPACRNQAGNAFARAAGGAAAEAREELLEKAAREYFRATSLDPGLAEYQSNLAAVYIELERYSEAEERIRKALDSGGGARALLLAGNLATVYGEFPRAEASYRLGLESAPDDSALMFALGRCYISLQKPEKAQGLVQRLEGTASRIEADYPSEAQDARERARKLGFEIEAATTEPLSCAACGRTWRVPRDLPAMSSSSIRAMPPDDSPAGACPSCGKVYCIACRKGELVDSRFTCPECGVALKLSDNKLRYLVRESLEARRKA